MLYDRIIFSMVLKLAYKLLHAVIGLAALSQVLFWLVEHWFIDEIGMIGFFLFCVGVFFIFNSSKPPLTRRLNVLDNIDIFWLATSISFFTLTFFTDYNILKAIFVSWGFILGFRAYFNFSQKRLLFLLIWSFLALPVIPLLGSTLGIFNRIFYTGIINFVMKADSIVGTALHDGSYRFSIDSGCSGVLGLYLLACLWCVITLKENKIWFKELFLSLGFFWILNTLRVFSLYIMHNKMHISDNIEKIDLTLGVILFASAVIFMYTKITQKLLNI